MQGIENLVRKVPAGEIVKPWLIWGPLYQDLSAYVQGLTLFERKGATVGRAAMAEVIEQAQEVLCSTPYEGQEISWRGEKARWELVRRPEKYLSWGTYHISNHLACHPEIRTGRNSKGPTGYQSIAAGWAVRLGQSAGSHHNTWIGNQGQVVISCFVN